MPCPCLPLPVACHSLDVFPRLFSVAVLGQQGGEGKISPSYDCSFSTHNDFLNLLLEGLAGQDGGQHSNEILDDIGDHPGFEETPGHVLRTRLALMFTLADPLLLCRNLQIELCEVVATIA